MEPTPLCKALQTQDWARAWELACALPRDALNTLPPDSDEERKKLAEPFVAHLLGERRLLAFLAQQLPTADGLEFLLAHYAHPSLRRACFCPLCDGESGVHIPHLFRTAVDAAQIAHAFRQGDIQNASTRFRDALERLCGISVDPSVVSVAAGVSPVAWYRDAAHATADGHTRQRLAILADLTHWFATGDFLGFPRSRCESRASFPLVGRYPQGNLPAQFRVRAAIEDFPPLLYPDPRMLLNTTYDAEFKQQLAWSWEASLQFTKSEVGFAVRWQLTYFRKPEAWSGGAVADKGTKVRFKKARCGVFFHL